MRFPFSLFTFATLVVAIAQPNPQDIEVDLVYALPNPTYTTLTGLTAQTVKYDLTSVLEAAASQITATNTTGATLAKRTPCAAQPTGAVNAPTLIDDSAASFTNSPGFAAAAKEAVTPSGYVQTFKNAHGANNAYGYMGYTSLDSYNVAGCAAKCDAIDGCMSFNVYFERGPSVDPGTGNSGCSNPAPYTVIKCAFWGGPVNADNAVNMGQWRNQFQVVIAGSNGYQNNSVTSPAGYSEASYLGNSAINAAYDSYGFDSYLGVALFNSGPFDVNLCAQACDMKSQYNIDHPPSDGSPVVTCSFFNTYLLYINNTSNYQGQYCAMYSESWSSQYATNNGQYRGADHFLIDHSYSFSKLAGPGTACENCAIHQASKDISYSSLQTYCSSLLGYGTAVTTTTTTVTTTVSAMATRTLTHTIIDDGYGASTSISTSVLVKRADSIATASVVATPDVLTKYPVAVVSSACSMQATPVSTTSTVVVTATRTQVTAMAQMSTVTAWVTKYDTSTD